MMEFDGGKALAYAREIAVPRLVGTDGEARARGTIRGRLAEFGYDARIERFRFFPAFPMFYAKAVSAAALAGLAIAVALEPGAPRLSALIAVATCLVALRGGKRYAEYAAHPDVDHAARRPWLARLFPRLGIAAESANVVATTGGDAGREFVVLAHYDSKSQNIAITTRIACVAGLYLGIVALAARLGADLIAPALAASPVARWTALALYAVALVGGVGVLSLRVTDDSPGALDNAGSVGVVLHLAEILAREAPPKGVRVRFLLTGAEELGLAGAGAHALALDPADAPRLLHVNLDGVGGGGRLYCTMETALFSGNARKFPEVIGLATRAAEAMGSKIRVLKRVIGGAADHFPLVSRGFRALTIGHYSRASRTVHTAADRPELLDADSLAEAGGLVRRVLRDFAESDPR
jgi:hypothetical protein